MLSWQAVLVCAHVEISFAFFLPDLDWILNDFLMSQTLGASKIWRSDSNWNFLGDLGESWYPTLQHPFQPCSGTPSSLSQCLQQLCPRAGVWQHAVFNRLLAPQQETGIKRSFCSPERQTVNVSPNLNREGRCKCQLPMFWMFRAQFRVNLSCFAKRSSQADKSFTYWTTTLCTHILGATSYQNMFLQSCNPKYFTFPLTSWNVSLSLA